VRPQHPRLGRKVLCPPGKVRGLSGLGSQEAFLARVRGVSRRNPPRGDGGEGHRLSVPRSVRACGARQSSLVSRSWVSRTARWARAVAVCSNRSLHPTHGWSRSTMPSRCPPASPGCAPSWHGCDTSKAVSCVDALSWQQNDRDRRTSESGFGAKRLKQPSITALLQLLSFSC
jgi:hypothetical protein